MIKFHICKFCGALYIPVDTSGCYICGHTLYPLDLEWTSKAGKTMEEIDAVRTSYQPREQYNQSAWLHREHIEITQRMSGSNGPKGFDRRYKEGVILPECPYCHGYYTQKIGTGSRMLSTGLLGLGSKKIGKQWHCCLCNSDF